MRPLARPDRLLRRAAIVIITGVAVLLAADSLAWWFAGRRIEMAFNAWVQQRRAAGLDVVVGPERLTGWPRAAVVRVAGVSVAGRSVAMPGGIRWEVPDLLLRVRPLPPWKLEVVPRGVQHLRVLGSPELALTAERLAAWLPLDGSPLFTITGERLRLGPAAFAPRFATIAALSVVARPAKDGSGTERTTEHDRLRIDARGLDLARGLVRARPLELAVLSADVTLIGPTPRGPDWARSLTEWRDSGGMIACRSFSLVSGPLAIGGSGRFELDQSLQPKGEARARIVGFAATLDALAASGAITDGEAAAAKAILTLLARPSHEGGPPEVDVPISLNGGTLSVGDIPLLRVPKVHWPKAAPRSTSAPL